MNDHHGPTRTEHDGLGSVAVPEDAYYGIHTMRALANFPLSGQRIPAPFIRALAEVKQACAETNASLGFLDPKKAKAIVAACRELAEGTLHEHIVVDPFQGGAGTSTNMNVNEVLASRATELLGGKAGNHERVHPLVDVNMHQSTNDVYPTALRVAVLRLLSGLETRIGTLQEDLQQKETEFRHVVKVGRTQLMDALPMTLSMTFGPFADGVSRDRWRIFKCRERIKRVNLGGTAIGTGLGAPTKYILKVADTLRRITGEPVSRAENLVDATQNLDVFVEVSGMLKAQAATLMKISGDLRLLSSGPESAIGELVLPPVQAGSSIMAGKVNPVIPEAVTQVAMRVMANDSIVTAAAGMAQLELNHLLPLIAHSLLESLTLLQGATEILAVKCVRGIRHVPARCREHVERSNALATALVPYLGYERVEHIVTAARRAGHDVLEEAVSQGLGDRETLARLLSPNRLCKLGFDSDKKLAGGD